MKWHKGTTLLTSGPSEPPMTHEEREELKSDERKLRRELDKALKDYLDRPKHDGDALKHFCKSMVRAIGRAKVYRKHEPGGMRQKLIGAYLEAALALSHQTGRPARPQDLIEQILSAWIGLIEVGEATPSKCPRKRIAVILEDGGILLSDEQVGKAMSSPAGKAAKSDSPFFR